jgi:hypothetical protein
LNRLLDALAPLAKFRKLKEFLHAKLPPGFPVKIGIYYYIVDWMVYFIFLFIFQDIPVVPTVTAKVSFQNFKKNFTINDDLFKIPSDYVEDVDKSEEEQRQ